jgi:plasmid stability protein
MGSSAEGDNAMPDILIRGVDAKTVQGLKKRAKANGRSLQGELKLVLQEAAGSSGERVKAILARWKPVFAGRRLESTADLIREDRER